MRNVLLPIAATAMAVASAQAELEPAMAQRLVGTSTATEASAADRDYLLGFPSDLTPGSVVATAGLYRHWPADHEKRFIELFGVDPTTVPREVPAEEVNRQVNDLLKQLQGRHPMEISARLYLAFRRSGKIVLRDGDRISLEVTFRGAVFTGISNGSIKRVLELAALADGKTPSQPPKPASDPAPGGGKS